MSELSPQDIILKNKIAQRIKDLREKTGLTQSQFAHKHEIDRQILSRWESNKNKRGITIYTIQRFCDMIDITLEEFFKDKIFDKRNG